MTSRLLVFEYLEGVEGGATFALTVHGDGLTIGPWYGPADPFALRGATPADVTAAFLALPATPGSETFEVRYPGESTKWAALICQKGGPVVAVLTAEQIVSAFIAQAEASGGGAKLREYLAELEEDWDEYGLAGAVRAEIMRLSLSALLEPKGKK